MKKNGINSFLRSRRGKKLLLAMKLTILLITLSLMQVSATVYSQATKFNFKVTDKQIVDVLKEIEENSDFRFFYQREQVDIERRVTVKTNNATVEKILDELFDGYNINYKVLEDNLILLIPHNKNSNNISFLQQQKSVSGKVIDSSGLPLPGVTVLIKGTIQGIVTNIEGNYSLPNVPGNATLVFSFVGMKTLEIPVDNQLLINVTMEEEIMGVDEVVVIGYTSTSRKNVASSVVSVSSEDIVGMSTSDARQVLQGKMAGVQVVNNSGDPGSGARIIIRGIGSFSNPDPLYVIDGIQGGDINSVPSQDIESITVLKDASTTAIYGSAAANGVVVITTKTGRTGNVQVSYDGSVGMASFTKRYDMLNASQYVDLVADIQHASGLELTDKLKSDYAQVTRTNWQEEIFRNSLVTDHNIRISGGGENVDYAFSSGYQNHESTVIDRNFQRLTFGAKMNEKLFRNRIRLGQHIRVRNDVYKGVLAGLGGTLNMAPYIPIYDPDNLGGYGRSDKVTDLTENGNPFNDVYNTDRESRNLSVNIELTGEVDLFKGLMYKTQARLTGSNYHTSSFDYPSNGFALQLTASTSENYSFGYSAFLENFFAYNNTFGDHLVSATLGNSWAPSSIYRSVTVGGSDYTSDAIQNVALANSNSITGASVNSGKSRLSYFGRLGYTFKERYVFNATVRRDASSVFGANNRWGTFYGLGVAWSITEEDFMKSADVISNLKLRASYGKTGNDNIPGFLTSSTVWKGTANNIVYSFGDGTDYAYGSTVNSVANPNLKWEETTQFDIGFDIRFLNNRLNFIVDYYNRSNEDLLIETQLPSSTGLGLAGSKATQWVNAASMKNTGFEFAMEYSDNSKDFKWDISLNATYSTNEVTALGTVGDIPISKGEWTTGIGNSTRTDIGHPLAAYYGYMVDHVVASQAEADELNAQAVAVSSGAVAEYKANLKPGDFVWKDIDGNGYLDNKDRTYIGDPSPTWQYGGMFNASYKGFDLQIQFHGLADVDVVNGVRYYTEGMWRPNNSTTNALKRWKQDGDITDVPAAGQNSASNLVFSDWYIEKGDYLRVKNITLGYTLPESMFNRTFSKVRVYLAAQNVLTLTGYSGYDPEISTYSANDNDVYIFARGIDQYQHPNPAIYRFGIQLNF